MPLARNLCNNQISGRTPQRKCTYFLFENENVCLMNTEYFQPLKTNLEQVKIDNDNNWLGGKKQGDIIPRLDRMFSTT